MRPQGQTETRWMRCYMFIVEVKHKISMKNGQCKFTISRALFLELYTSYLGTTENTKQKIVEKQILCTNIMNNEVF